MKLFTVLLLSLSISGVAYATAPTKQVLPPVAPVTQTSSCGTPDEFVDFVSSHKLEQLYIGGFKSGVSTDTTLEFWYDPETKAILLFTHKEVVKDVSEISEVCLLGFSSGGHFFGKTVDHVVGVKA
ncbi:MAG: hypothetical protein P4L79_10440 [Legionella sp.]|uniref:hypothetical protein n=1 Tax=Legionella sp. TaxID=459 RepID=UPI00284881D5|nr:hypothetical protein [Legionella sp.]